MNYPNTPIIFLLFLTLSPSLCSAEKTTNQPDKTTITYSPYPIIYYTPETTLGYGLGLITTIRDNSKGSKIRPDSISTMLTNTLKNQIYLKVEGDFYFNDQQGNLQSKIIYMDYPEKYFGNGNEATISSTEIDELEESYTNNATSFSARLVHNVWQKFRLGFHYKFGRSEIYDLEGDGQLLVNNPTGLTGGVTSGLGPVLDYDDRNNIFYPSTGGWYQFTAIYHDEKLGSDFNYQKYSIDLRHFLCLKTNHIIAFQGLVSDSNGDIPFYTMTFPDIRGIYGGVFSNKNMVTGQIEYRFPIHERWSGATFLAAGDVYEQWGEAKFSEIKYAGGIGLRFALNREEKINIRLDLAVSPWGFGPYLKIQEKF